MQDDVIMIYSNGDRYEGKMKDQKRHFIGKMLYSNKDVYEGEWNQDLMRGQGTYTHANGTKVEGKFYDDMPDGTCTVTSIKGEIKHVQFKLEYDLWEYKYKIVVCRWLKKT